MRIRRILIGCLAAALGIGLSMRWTGMAHSGWVIALSAAALAFLFLLPVMGERARQPSDASERRVHFGD